MARKPETNRPKCSSYLVSLGGTTEGTVFVSTLNKYSSEEDSINKICESLAGRFLAFGRCWGGDGARTSEDSSVRTLCPYPAVRGLFSLGKWIP